MGHLTVKGHPDFQIIRGRDGAYSLWRGWEYHGPVVTVFDALAAAQALSRLCPDQPGNGVDSK